MRILIVSALLPWPLHSGGQIRVYNLLKRLSKNHSIHLFTFLRDELERQYFPQLSFCSSINAVYRGHAWQPSYVVRSIFSTYPLLFTTYALGSMKEKITDELATHTYDLIHIEPGYVWSALPIHQLPLVITEHNIEYMGYSGYVARFPIVPLRPFLYADVLKLQMWEKRIWGKATRVIAVSDEDRQVIEACTGNEKIYVIPNGVDVKEFRYQPKKTHKQSVVFLFVGNFAWMQNRDAVNYLLRDIWPSIKTHFPNALLRIVGKQAPHELKKLITGAHAQLLDDVEDITKEYEMADALIAPIRIGSGSRYKILEAMASGVPVITTAVGASGLDVKDGQELLIANTPEEFLEAIDTLITDTKLHTAMLFAARRRIEKSYSWDSIAKDLERVWEGAANRVSL